MSAAVRIAILADATKARREINSVGDAATKQAKGLSRLGGALKTGLAVGGIAAAGAAARNAVSDAIAYQRVLAQTNIALRANAGASGQSTTALRQRAAAIESTTGATLDENDVLTGQQNLLRAGIRGEQAFAKAAQLSADVAAARGTTFEAASKLVAKALQRPEKATALLAKQGVILSDAQQQQITAMTKAGNAAGAQSIVLDALSTKYQGAAKAAGSDATAGFRRLQDTAQDLARDFAIKLLPAAAAVAGFLSQHQNAALVVAGAFAILGGGVLAVSAAMKVASAATTAWSAATKAAAAAQWLLDAALDANPVGVVIIALVALAGILVVLYKHSDRFRSIVQAAFHAMQVAVSAVVSFVAKNWPLLFGPIGLAVAYLVKKRDAILGVFGSIRTGVVNIFAGIGNVLVAAIRGALNLAVDYFNIPIRAYDAIAGKIHAPQLPLIPHVKMATGGIVRARSGGTLALLAEAGKDEAVVPLDGRNRFGNTYVTLNATITSNDPDAVYAALQRKIKRDGLGLSRT